MTSKRRKRKKRVSRRIPARPSSHLRYLTHRQHLLQTLEVLTRGGRASFLSEKQRKHAEAARRAARRWTAQPGVQGFGVARRTVAGKRTDEFVLKVYVEKKLPPHEIASPAPPIVRVPGVDVPVAVDVEEIGVVRAQSGTPIRPAPGGAPVSHVQGETGTLGCLVRRKTDGALCILSNSHVLALSGEASRGDPIIQPSVNLGGTAPADRIADLLDWTAFTDDENHPNVADAAVARVIDPATVTARIIDIGVPAGLGTVEDGMHVRMYGAMSGEVRSTVVRDPAAHLHIQYKHRDGSLFSLPFTDLVLCDPISLDGDSGAVVVDDQNRVVGLHVAGSTAVSIFCRIGHVLDQLELELVTADGEAVLTKVTPPVGTRAEAIDTLARTVWGEARGEGEVGMQAVAAVVVNRARCAPKWGGTVEEVCRRPKQFSCWNAGDPNRASLLAVTQADAKFNTCLQIAAEAINGTLTDPTNGATHYYAIGIDPPSWATGQPCAEIKHHVFFKNIA